MHGHKGDFILGPILCIALDRQQVVVHITFAVIQ